MKTVIALVAVVCVACGGRVSATDAVDRSTVPAPDPTPELPPPATSPATLACSLPSAAHPSPSLTLHTLAGISIKPVEVIAYFPGESVTGQPGGDCHFVPQTNARSCWSSGTACSTDDRGNSDCGGGAPPDPHSWLRIELTETAAACSRHDGGLLSHHENTLVVNVYRTGSGEIDVGTYAVPSNGEVGVFAVQTTGTRCRPNGEYELQLDYRHFSFKGSVSITQRSASAISGTIDLEDDLGRALRASFEAPLCRRTATFTTCCG